MHIVIAALSILLALEFVLTGTLKVLNTADAQKNAVHLGISTGLIRLIGLAELAAAAGMLVGLAFPPLAIVTAAAVCLLMAGALGSHLRVRDNVRTTAPAAITGLAAAALLTLTLITI